MNTPDTFAAATGAAARIAVQLLLGQQPPAAPPPFLLSCETRHEEAEAVVTGPDGPISVVAGKLCGCQEGQIDIRPHASLPPERLDNDTRAMIMEEVTSLLPPSRPVPLIIIIKEEDQKIS